jgi:serine/threonine-protein kinase 24/25/MST4
MLACVQMATGTPPLAELHPMRALFLIPKNAAPQLQGPYSPALRNFVGRCLHKVRAGPPVVCLL